MRTNDPVSVLQYSFPHHHHTAQPLRRQLSHHEQREILTDIQENHRFQQPPFDPRSPTNSHQHPFSIFQQQQYSQQQERNIIPQQSILNPAQQSIYSPQSQLTHQQTSLLFPQPQSPVAGQQSPILLSLQQSPLSSPQFSALFSQEPQTPFSTKNSVLPTQPSPVLLSLQNSPLSVHQSKELFSLQLQTPHATQESPRTTQQSPEIISQQTKSPLSTQQSTLVTQESRENQPNLEPKTQDQEAKEEYTTDLEGLKEDVNTEFTIQQSISDPEELKKLQLLELQREQERKERLKKQQEEQLRLIQEQHERRLKERLEEDKRDEERRLKLQEQLRKIYEEKERRRKQQEQEQRRLIQERKERLLKLQQEEQLRIMQDKERQKKEEEEKLKLIKEQKEKEEKQQQEPSLSSVVYSQPTPATEKMSQEIILQPSQKEKRPQQRARIVEEPDPSIASEELFLQNERQKLYYQLKEAQEQQEKKQHLTEEKQQTQESQQITRNNQRPTNQFLQTKSRQPLAQQSKLSQLEEQLHQKQLQEQLQKQFQLQLLQRQDLLRQLKLAVSNAATPTNEDQIAPGPVPISAGNSSAQLYLANGQKIQVMQSPRQGRPLSDNTPRNGSLTTSSISTTTQRPSRALLEELTKGVIPPGADFEVLRHKQDGALEEIGQQLPQNLPQKKVTFVFLEEQADGSVKVKGVRGNNNGEPEEEQSSAGDVESIIKQIQEGDLKLPPSSNNRVLQQSPVPQLATSWPPAAESHYIPQTTVNSLSTTSKPNTIIKTVSSNFNIQPHATTAKPNSIIKTVSSNLNFQPHSGMDFLQTVTFPPPYDIDSIVKTASGVNAKTQVQTAQTDLPAPQVNSPYSVEVHPAGQNPVAHIFSQGSLSPHTQLNSGSSNSYLNNNQQSSTPSANTGENGARYKQKSNTVTPHPTVTQFPSTVPAATFFTPNKYSPSHVPQYTTSAPEKKFGKHEPFLPTEPSFVNPSQSHSAFFVPGNGPQQTTHNHNTLIPGIIYANPATQVPTVTTDKPIQQGAFQHHDIGPSDHNYNERDFQQTVEAPSLQTPTRISAPPPQDILKEPDRLVPLDEDGSFEYQTKVAAPLSLAEVLKKEGLFAMARFLRESGLNDMLNDTGECLCTVPLDRNSITPSQR